MQGGVRFAPLPSTTAPVTTTTTTVPPSSSSRRRLSASAIAPPGPVDREGQQARDAPSTTSLVSSAGANGTTFNRPTDASNEAGPSRATRASPSVNSTSVPAPDTAPSNTDHHASSRSPVIRRPQTPETTLSSLPQDRPTTPHLDLVNYPTPTLLRLLANLLQQIALANDRLRPEIDDLQSAVDDLVSESNSNQTSPTSEHPTSSPSQPNQQPSSSSQSTHSVQSRSSRSTSITHPPPNPSPTTALFTPSSPPQIAFEHAGSIPLFTASKQSLTHPSSLLSFHARHIPSITIESYLLRILKYCPTTNEVFLGLLVYFDRMSRLGTAAGVGGESAGASKGIGRGFAIDSYNIHRLLIAGVTVASKFFSDVFYTNSRYAKVGGLPPHELNQLELQFLLLNDFRLSIPAEEMQRYGDRLLSFSEGQSNGEAVDVTSGTQPATTQTDTGSSAKAPEEVKSAESQSQGGETSRRQQSEIEVVAATISAADNGKMDVDPPASQTQSAVAEADNEEASRGDTDTSTGSATAETSNGITSGLKGWVKSGDEVIGGVVGGRMTSPMRD